MEYCSMSKNELEKERKIVEDKYNELKALGLKLDMSRGKPSPEQLDLSLPMLDVVNSTSDLTSSVDCRNYGVVDGIPEAKELVAGILGVSKDEVIIFGNSSLNIMFDVVTKAVIKGIMGSEPWIKNENVKFLCPVPGYDRHFSVTEYHGINLVNVPMTEKGPDMDIVEEYVNKDSDVKGIWCVPKYSNPDGITYSDDVVKRMAALKPAAKDFRIYWDNAYCVHDLFPDDKDKLLDIYAECKKNGSEDMVYMFCSTSKVSFAGAGIAALAASKANIDDILSQLKWQTIGPDKINQLRHVRFFKDYNGILEHMKKHAELLRPKFSLVHEIFERELGGLGIGNWTNPKGGYFISFNSLEGCAKNIVKTAKEAGVVLTGAGATFPYGKDPKDSNIRIAPSYPSLDELEKATELFTICVRLVTLNKLLGEKSN
ncbi:MAG: aminotransferase [Lachnospiraceae bacterium]|nr:aminotransferase [Lachnospiraceae bacterium]